MLTRILLVIVSVVYIILLILKYAKKTVRKSRARCEPFMEFCRGNPA